MPQQFWGWALLRKLKLLNFRHEALLRSSPLLTLNPQCNSLIQEVMPHAVSSISLRIYVDDTHINRCLKLGFLVKCLLNDSVGVPPYKRAGK